MFPDKRRQLARLVEIAKQKENLQMDLLQRSFERAEHQLKDALQQRQKEVKVGTLLMSIEIITLHSMISVLITSFKDAYLAQCAQITLITTSRGPEHLGLSLR